MEPVPGGHAWVVWQSSAAPSVRSTSTDTTLTPVTRACSSRCTISSALVSTSPCAAAVGRVPTPRFFPNRRLRPQAPTPHARRPPTTTRAAPACPRSPPQPAPPPPPPLRPAAAASAAACQQWQPAGAGATRPMARPLAVRLCRPSPRWGGEWCPPLWHYLSITSRCSASRSAHRITADS